MPYGFSFTVKGKQKIAFHYPIKATPVLYIFSFVISEMNNIVKRLSALEVK